ncbi:MAG: ABC transporter permease subunit [Chlorobia bacterium]|nr:ABC transporter permease subunit [Fimbriimonadaceae bacterium]
MKFRVYKALARGVFLESLRRKDLWVVAILGFLILMGASALGFFGVQGLQVFVKDLAVTVLGAFSTIVAILTSTRMLPEEIKQRTLYPLLSRPITRLDLLIGKLVGSILVTWMSFLILAALTALALFGFGVSFELIMLQYIVAKMMGLALVCAFGLTLSIYMTPAAASTTGFIFTFGSALIIRGLTSGYEHAGPGMQFLFKFLNAVLPQFTLFDLGGRAANVGWAPVPLWVMGFLLGYWLLYSSGLVAIAWTRFQRKAI